MFAEKKVLVVDDEAVVCQACDRILSDSGFNVDTTQDSVEGLKLAAQSQYAAVVLDIRMPLMDGISFLKKLREFQPSVPVVMITGYADTASATAAMRLGAMDYIPKPFTPDELLSALKRLPLDTAFPPTVGLGLAEATEAIATERRPARHYIHQVPESAPHRVSISEQIESRHCKTRPLMLSAGKYLFLDESWIEDDIHGMMRCGAFLSREEWAEIARVELPKNGELVYRGLPLARFSFKNGRTRLIPSPTTGVVIETNAAIGPRTHHESPYKEGWLARIRPVNIEDDLAEITPRSLYLLTSDESSSRQIRREMELLGCEIQTASSLDEIRAQLDAGTVATVLIDARGIGANGPVIAKGIREINPANKVIVLADADSAHEEAYRVAGVFFYAVTPFADGEIIDILEAVFRPEPAKLLPVRPTGPLPQSIARIQITNERGEPAVLLAPGELLNRNAGLGRRLVQAIHERNRPVTVDLGHIEDPIAELTREIVSATRTVVLQLVDRGALPGSLYCEMEEENRGWRKRGADSHKIITACIQPDTAGQESLALDARTEDHLARHLLRMLEG